MATVFLCVDRFTGEMIPLYGHISIARKVPDKKDPLFWTGGARLSPYERWDLRRVSGLWAYCFDFSTREFVTIGYYNQDTLSTVFRIFCIHPNLKSG